MYFWINKKFDHKIVERLGVMNLLENFETLTDYCLKELTLRSGDTVTNDRIERCCYC